MDYSSRKHRLYGLIGHPLGHSFSESFFNAKFEAENIDARYVNYDLPSIDSLDTMLAANPGLCGFNVTIPYKEQIIGRLDAIDPLAAEIGAVNVVKVFRQPDGSISLKGYNSDVTGFECSIRPMIEAVTHRRALVLGTGGASKAVAYALRRLGVEPTPVSRTARAGVITYGDLTPQLMADYRIVVNTTPLGMYPLVDECPDIPYDCLDSEYICYDLLYNPSRTLFMKRAAAAGATVCNGLEMLLLQAFEAWNIWNK